MLGKLLKYEFRATGRIFLPSYAVLLVMSVVARLFYGNGRIFTVGEHEGLLVGIISLIMIMLFTAVWVVTLAVTLRRFWTNLLGREGYLTNVLPVHPWEHMLSKLVTASVWNILSGLASILALWIMLGGVLNLLDINWSEFMEFWHELWQRLAEEGATGQAVLFTVQAVLASLLSVFQFILSVYAAMCVGQLVNTHRIWASIGAYFGVNIAQSTLFSQIGGRVLAARFFGTTVYSYEGPISIARELARGNELLLWYLSLELLFCAALFFAGTWILRRRLNLQ